MADLNLDPAKTALLALHFHNFLVTNNPMAQQRNLAARARAALDGARQAGILVIHVAISQQQPGGTPPRNKFRRVVRSRIPYPPGEGSPQELAAVVKGLEPVGDEPVVHGGANAFYGTNLQALLEGRGIDTLVLMGAVTEFVVESTARYAAEADYRLIILEDCCIGFTEQAHKCAITVLDWLADMSSSDELLESVRAS